MEQVREQAFGSTIILTSNNVNTPADAHQEEANPNASLATVEGETSPPGRTLSPATTDPELQQQGSELQEVLRMFKQTTTSPLSSCILQTPKNEVVLLENTGVSEGGPSNQQRKSSRLNAKNSGGKPIVRLAHDLVVKKCGVIAEVESLDDATLKDYLDLLKKTLTGGAHGGHYQAY
jgi:hypothetical protein